MQYIINIYGNEKTSIIWHMYIYGVKAYARLSRVFYDAVDKKNFYISNNKGQNILTFPKIDDIKWTNHRFFEQFVTRWKGLTRYLFDSGSTFGYVVQFLDFSRVFTDYINGDLENKDC